MMMKIANILIRQEWFLDADFPISADAGFTMRRMCRAEA
jgi:hypothetical protein